MIRSVEASAEDAKIAELKRLITTVQFESFEKLEDAVDAILWADEDEPRNPVPRVAKPR